MTLLYCNKTNQKIVLHQQVASSGEGEVWTTNDSKILAKIYHSSTPQRQEKLKVMFKHPPEDPNQGRNHISFAWPQSLLTNKEGMVMGFLMPKIQEGRELIDIYNPRRRNKVGLKIDWNFLHVVSHNIASIIHSIHKAGYVLGDIKPQNILVNSQAVPSIIDTDSFQVTNPQTGHIYRCLVGSEGFTPPELLNQDFAQINQTEVHDRFRLGVVIYYLLFGSHPFQGKWVGSGDSPELTELIRNGDWAFATRGFIRPSPLTIPLDILHPELKECFTKCFTDGYNNPRLRPTAQEWQQSLQVALQSLKQCDKESQHFYYLGNKHCYWCQRQEELKIDIFSDPYKVQMAVDSLRQDAFYQSSAIFSPRTKKSRTHYRHPNLKGYPPQRAVMRPNQYLFRRSFSQYATPILNSIPIFAALLILFFLFQEFPQSKSSLNNQSNTNVILSKDPDDAIAFNVRGYERYLQGEYFGAITDFNKAIQIDPRLADAYLNRGLVNKALGNEQLSERDLLKAIALDPDNINMSSLSTTRNVLPKSLNSKIQQVLEDESLKKPQNNQAEMNDIIEKKILTKKQFKELQISKNSASISLNVPSIKVSPIQENYLHALEKYDQLFKTKTPLQIPDAIKTNELPEKIKILPEDRDIVNDKKIEKSSKLKSNLADVFVQRGIYYKNLGIYEEAIKNYEQAYLILQKEGNSQVAKEIQATIDDLRMKVIPY